MLLSAVVKDKSLLLGSKADVVATDGLVPVNRNGVPFVWVDSFHAEVSQLVDASHMRLESGKDDDKLTVCTYAFRSDCSDR